VTTPPKLRTLVDLVPESNGSKDSRLGYTWLIEGETPGYCLKPPELDRAARSLAAKLQSTSTRGDVTLLLFRPGLDFIVGLFGCVYAGLIAIPAFLPRGERDAARLKAIIEDARPTLALTSPGDIDRARSVLRPDDLRKLRLTGAGMHCAEHDGAEYAGRWRPPSVSPDDTTILQYT